jgi:endonuclease-3 related protein
MTATLHKVYHRLLDAFGPQHWWPGDSPLEVMVGAVLTQNTSWKNVERAIENLRDQDLLSCQQLHEISAEELGELIRPAGYYRLKAQRLKNLIALVVDEYGGSLESMFSIGAGPLRQRLLSVVGIGPETADSIVLYAANLPTFVVDTYSARVLKRHGWIEPEADYHAIKDYFESNLDEDVQMFNEYHALLVRVGKEYCRKTPQCDQCPLFDLLPDGGPLDPRQ